MSTYSNDILFWGIVGGVIGGAVGSMAGRPGVGAISGAVAGGAILPFAFGYSPPAEIKGEDASGELPDLGARVNVGWVP